MKLEIVDIPHGEIQPDPDNPNEMAAAQLNALRVEISQRGFVQPCLVRPIPPHSGNPEVRYQLIDGEHRWRLLGELGAETVPCVVNDADEDDAKVRTITMNFLRGNPIPIKLSHLLADLSDRIPESELRSRLALDGSQLKNYLDLAGYLGEEPQPPRPNGTPEKPGVEVAVVATHEQAEQIQGLLDGLTGGDAEKESAVIARKARERDAA